MKANIQIECVCSGDEGGRTWHEINIMCVSFLLQIRSNSDLGCSRIHNELAQNVVAIFCIWKSVSMSTKRMYSGIQLPTSRSNTSNSMKCTGSIVSVYCFSAALSDWMCVILETGFSFMLRLDSIHDHWELAFANLCATVWAQPSCGFIASQASKPLGRLPTVCLGFGIFKQQ